MRLSISHSTRYRFTAPQSRLVQLLRLTPQDSVDQTVVHWHIGVDCDVRLREARDGYGNRVTMLYADGPIEGIEISVDGEVLTAGDVDTSIDPVGLHHYLAFHAVVPPPHTILRGVRKLPPATLMVVEPDGRRTSHNYWALDFRRDPAEERLAADDLARYPIFGGVPPKFLAWNSGAVTRRRFAARSVVRTVVDAHAEPVDDIGSARP